MSRRLHLGCGPWLLDEPWENYDQDVDLCKPLPFPDKSTQFILCEHTIEHLPFLQGFGFLQECYRILEPYGVLRLSFPDVTRVTRHNFEPYAKFLQQKGQPHQLHDVYRSMLIGWGHQACWTGETTCIAMEIIGFDTTSCHYGVSVHPELDNIDQHHMAVGVNTAVLESTIIEGQK